MIGEAHQLHRLGTGWVVGHPVDHDGRPIDLEREQAADIDPAEPAAAQGWWGSFVAISQDARRRVRAWRDPSGAVPCYFVQCSDALIFGSEARAVLAAAGKKPVIDRESLGLALRFPDLRSERTSLESLRELLPGQMCSIEPDGAIVLSANWIEPHWRPITTADSDAVRRAVREGVTYDLHGSSRPLLQLSGGLDSAIVAAVAREVGRELAAVNLITPGPEGDERRFAREIAAHLGIPLLEREMRIEAVDILETRAGFLPRPTHRLFAQSMDAAVQQAAADLGHDAVLTGGGGDSVFAYLLAGSATADPLSRLALRSALSTALDEAAVEQVSCWRVVRLALAQILRPARWHESASHLSPDILSLPRPDHPWLAAARRWPPGKQAHLAALVTIQNYLDPFRAMPRPVHFPLLHRPVIEACLGVPTEAWVAGGRNRAVARKAFAHALPHSIIGRRSKGTYERFAAQLFEHNRSAVRDHLLGGVLRELRIIDMSSLEGWFASQQPLRSNRMLALVEAESWCRQWVR
jgi:asparagine synthase (glutamine-hydrolysing)